MNRLNKLLSLSLLLMGSLLSATTQAAPNAAADANAKALAKLQTMVKAANTERDLLKADKDKLSADIEQLKKDVTAKASDEERVSGELAAQKSNNATVSNTLQQTHGKLLEVIEKYNALNKSKNELSTAHLDLENSHKQTESFLQTCESKNIKLFEAGKEVLSTYQNKNLMDSLLKADPIFQFKSVEMEGIVQEYEDKLNKQKNQAKEVSVITKTDPVTN
jgi:chromosome segregation ATPase